MLRLTLLLAAAGHACAFSASFAPLTGLTRATTPVARNSATLGRLPLRMSESETGQVELSEEKPTQPKGPSTLTDATEWRLAMQFTGPNPNAPPVEVTCKVKFVEDEGYEPPQGPIEIDPNSKYLSQQLALWKLGEDPEAELFDKAGFWIWGIFEEPKYPYFFTQFELTQEIPLSDGVIPAGFIYGQADITRDPERGVVLENGVLSYREPVKIQADAFGLSDGILAEIRPIGKFVCRPV